MDDLKLLFVGDVMLGRGVNEILEHTAPHYPWGNTLEVFGRADFRACNLECAISNRGEPWPDKMFTFRSGSHNVAVLGVARIDAVSLANNHALDFGYEALSDTLTILDAASIAHAGAGRSLDDALRPAFVQAGGAKIGMVAFTDNEPEWEAGQTRAGIAYTPVDLEEERAERLFRSIEKARRACDVLIVSAHWGPNWGYEPPPRQIPFAHRIIDLGADIVFGHSGHVFRGVEIYRERPILYCTGNFIDDYAVDEQERNDESFIFVVEHDSTGTQRLRLYPTVIEQCQALLAEAGRADEIAHKMTRLCGNMGTPTLWHPRERYLEIPIRRGPE